MRSEQAKGSPEPMRAESHVGRAATGGELSGRGKTAGREGRLARRQASSGNRVTPALTPTVAVEREHRLADGWGPIDALDASFLRAENEDDDGYDPFSDRPAAPEPLFERDPWK